MDKEQAEGVMRAEKTYHIDVIWGTNDAQVSFHGQSITEELREDKEVHQLERRKKQ